MDCRVLPQKNNLIASVGPVLRLPRLGPPLMVVLVLKMTLAGIGGSTFPECKP